MLALVVNSRLHPRRGSPFLNRPPLSPDVPAALLPYLPFPSSRDEKLVTATPLDSALTNGDACKSFKIRSYPNCRVGLRFLTKFSENRGTKMTSTITNSCPL